MKNLQDVIIIGGGPVGSLAALILSKLGKKVTVFEEHQKIGYPVHCAGHLGIKSLRSLGLYPLPNKIIENEFSRANFYSSNGFSFPVVLSKPVTCTVNRGLFDEYIFNRAKNAGVSFQLNSIVQSLLTENGFVRGVKVIQGNNKKENFRAKIVLDAEGVSSRLIKQTSLIPLDPKQLVYAVESQVENVKDLQFNQVHVFFGKIYAPGFYAWLIPQHDGLAKIGLATNYGNPDDFLKRLIFHHPIASQYLSKIKIKNKEFHSIPLGGPIPNFYSNGFMAMGDVASQVKPTTGGGIIFGLRSSIIAAQVANLAIDNNDVSGKFLKLYQSRFIKNYSFDFSVMLRIRSFLNSISDQKLDKILRFCKRIGLNKAIENVEEIDLQGRTLFKTIVKPTVFVTLIYLLINYLVANDLNADKTPLKVG